jgi:hypothetical protein
MLLVAELTFLESEKLEPALPILEEEEHTLPD